MNLLTVNHKSGIKKRLVSQKIVTRFLIVTSLIFFSIFIFSTNTSQVSAQAAIGTAKPKVEAEIPFGGIKISPTTICTCNTPPTDLLDTIYDFRTRKVLSILYKTGVSRIYREFNLFGTFFLGTYTKPTDVCKIISGNSCVTYTPNAMFGILPGTGTSGE